MTPKDMPTYRKRIAEREESTTTYIIALNVNQLNTYTVFSHIVSLDKTKFNYMLLTRDTLDSKTQIN